MNRCSSFITFLHNNYNKNNNTPLFFLNHFFTTFPLSPRFYSSGCRTFMEVVKAIASHGSTSHENVAIKADDKRYGYNHLVSSAWRISNLLSSHDQKTVDGTTENKSLNGARIGVVAKPSAEFVAGVLAVWLSGGVAVPLALSYPEAELLHVMTDSDVSMILSTKDHSELMQKIAEKTAAQFSLIPDVPSSDVIDGVLEKEIHFSNKVEGDDPALILYTSGTTGKPKGVVHTHNSILAQVKTLSTAWEYTSSDCFLHCLPLHHILIKRYNISFVIMFYLLIDIYNIFHWSLTLSIHVHGLFNALFAPLYAGSMVEFMPKFSVSGIWKRWRESYPKDGTKLNNATTVFTGVPTMYTRLIQGYEAMDPDLQAASASAGSQLRLMMCGSSALPLPVMQQWEAITGHRLLERYGMTEFVMALSNPLKGVRKGGTVGKPFPGVQVKILADNDGNEGVGELCIKSPSLFKEYWKRPEVTKESFIEGGFFKTGDAVKVDEDGYYVILGRTNADIMKVGGYKLSALEIEAILLEHPAISECCVLGLPDKTYGEAVTAIIVPNMEIKTMREKDLKPAITLDELCSWAKQKLAPYKLPTRLFLWDSLPRNAMGKVNKKELKTKLAAEEQ
ncbi:hypothetical protein M8C21_016100 [Ambrosia artemisiifolia]|uniref:4-coumarate--CoA ligase n=1 Tax=Ambrosia artemisiifolia TaxID=4212 RepID=A0AAD5C731_AMBAR|nr:hypothetical protein M8C21_016100 [Ambrosia artemisiifolia]